ncbi:MAG TPA: YqgQ family protein [Sporosarcina psychrophila]|uniref:YqgQ family protein n=1 Tax=Sporosarcina psychrophila TaxID=1476 RepID=A0A921FWD1_SPOPS|nr:YqgQ family protein [Sporosarcina psychrophila]
MRDFLAVLQLLKRFGIHVYTGNRKDDIDMVQSEVKDLYDNGLILKEDYLKAVLILRSEAAKM